MVKFFTFFIYALGKRIRHLNNILFEPFPTYFLCNKMDHFFLCMCIFYCSLKGFDKSKIQHICYIGTQTIIKCIAILVMNRHCMKFRNEIAISIRTYFKQQNSLKINLILRHIITPPHISLPYH
jgi:hypothetical protein